MNAGEGPQETTGKVTEMSDCERCSNYVFDEETGEYYCEAPIDQDAWERMMMGPKQSCSYYIEDGEYKTVRKQI